jgi:hypothetical protein
MEASSQRGQWLKLLGENWSAADPRSALGFTRQLLCPFERALTVRTVLAKVMEADGKRAAEFALTLPAGTARRQGMELVLPQWSVNDSEGVRAWLAEMTDDAARKEAMEILSAR